MNQKEPTRAALRRRGAVRAVVTLVVVFAVAILAAVLGGDGSPEKKPTSAPEPTPTAEAACGAEAPPEPSPRQYDSPPDRQLERDVDYVAEIDTSCGTITLDLLEKSAPANVNSFVFLAREGFYDGLIFYRIEQNAVVETGDPEPDPLPTADPTDGPGVVDETLDGPGYTIPDELPRSNEAFVYGAVAMTNDGPNTGGSRFFIVVHDPPNPEDTDKGFEKAGLRPDYSIFGRVDPKDEGSADTLITIATRDTLVGDDPRVATRPAVPIYVNSITIAER